MSNVKRNQSSKSCFTDGCFLNLCTKKSRSVEPGRSLLSASFNVTSQDDSEDEYPLITQAMNNLSLQEREQVYEDLHGVRKPIEENEELIESTLKRLDVEISNIKTKAAYGLAEEMSNEFVHDRKFRLMFLRACRFDARQAANRMVIFFEEKLQYFGSSKLTTSVRVSDLDEEDLDGLNSGRFQLLPYRDRTGRAIISLYLRKNYKYKSVGGMIRAIWYFFMVVLEDEETQRKGLVIVIFTSDSDDTKDFSEKQFLKRAPRVLFNLPFFIVGAHFCMKKSSYLTMLLSAFLSTAEEATRIKFRFHYGTQTENLFSLMTFGIPTSFVPITNEGNVKTDKHLKWLERRRIMERAIISGLVFNGIDLPSKFDVLLGKGKPIQNHTGNMHLREVIDDYKERYGDGEKGYKLAIAGYVVRLYKESTGGRFLKQAKDGWWYEVTDDFARRGVFNRFRSKSLAATMFVSKQTSSDDRKRAKVV